MKKQNKTIDPLRTERHFAGKKVRRRSDVKKVVSAAALEPRNIKVHISIKLDADVLEYFKRRARQPGAPPYQTQINQILREVIDREGSRGALYSDLSAINPALRAIIERDQERFPGEALVRDDRFVDAIAERVKQRL
ncbi:MAG: BrnA antitoxin family protein [Acidobacteriota bacterium]